MSDVILFSGGMDSFCLLKNHTYDKILFFITGTKDNLMELRQLYNMEIDGIIDSNIVHIINLPISIFELPNKIIPHRNAVFCLMASNYGNNIFIGTTKGDTTRDKDYVFKSQIEGILNYFGQDSEKVVPVGYPYSIQMPFKDMTKTEIISNYINNSNNINELLKYSRSCYTNTDKECGKCRSCLRKAVALRNNNIDYSNVFEMDPLSVILSERDIKKMQSRPLEWQEYQKALG